MIQVSDVGKLKETSSSKVKKTSSGGDFSTYLRDAMQVSDDNAVSGTAQIATANAMFAAQEVDADEERERRKKQLGRGKSLLEKLEEIRNGLLRGYISKDTLIEISRFVKEKKFEAEDETLNEIIDEIELRVEVELAKLMK